MKIIKSDRNSSKGGWEALDPPGQNDGGDASPHPPRRWRPWSLASVSHCAGASFKKFSLGDIIWLLTLSCAGTIDWKSFLAVSKQFKAAFLKIESKSGWHWHFGSSIFITICYLFFILLLNAAQRESFSPSGPKISVTGWQVFVTGWCLCHSVVVLKDALHCALY